MKRASSNEKDVVGSYHAITGIDGSTFDYRQDVSLYALTRDVWPMPRPSPCDFVDLIEENDPRVLNSFDCRPRDLVHVYQPFFLLLHQILRGFIDAHLATLGT